MDTYAEDHDKQIKDVNISSPSEENKIDIRKLVAVVPPPSMLLSKHKKVLKEKRVRLVYDPSIEKDEAKVSKVLADELGIKDFIEVSIAGKKRFRFRAVIIENMSNDIVYVNPDVMKIHGVADNSICTIRSSS